jgi:O-antigen/teichoic acid export membrane protein
MGLLRNTSMTVAGYYVANGAKAAIALVVASTLGAKGTGTFAMVRILPHLGANILGMGVTIAVPYLIGGRRHTAQAATETVVALGLLLGAVGYTAWFLFAGFLHGRFYTQLPAGAVLLVGAGMPLLLLRNYLNSVQQGMQSFRGANLVLCMEEFGTLLLLLPLLLGAESVGGTRLLPIAAVGGAAASCLTAILLLMWHRVWSLPRLHWAIVVEAIRFGLKGHVGRLANVLNWRLDAVILSALASVEVVGCYAVASQAAELFRPLSQAVTYVLRPLMSSLSSAQARVRGIFLYRRVFMLNLSLILVMALVGGHAILLIFGDEFATAVPAFQILLIGLAAHGADGVVAGYNVGIGRPEFNTYTALAGLVITVVADLTLIPPYGLIGAATASSIAYSVKAVTMTAIFLSSCNLTLTQLVGIKEYSPDAA